MMTYVELRMEIWDNKNRNCIVWERIRSIVQQNLRWEEVVLYFLLFFKDIINNNYEKARDKDKGQRFIIRKGSKK